MTAVYGSQSTPRVLMVVSTLKANTKRYSSFSGSYNGLQKKKTILTIQTVKYFDQIGQITFVLSVKIPHVQRLFQVKIASIFMLCVDR